VQKPDTVPSDAEWNVQAGEWELTPRDATGRPEGVVRSWRADGTRSSEYEYRAGELEGAFKRFHPDGSIAREGLFRAGRQHGTTVAHGYDGPGVTPEPMQSCCVPPGAWQLQQDFEDGGLSEVRWYDRAGVHLLRSGAPHPRRPEGVPREARFDEGRDQWGVASYSAGGHPEGVWLRWARDGVLRERDEYREGKAHGLWQRFDEAGHLSEQSEWRDGARSGSYRRLRVPAELYADARVFEERGAFDRDQAVGAWSLVDAEGVLLRFFDLGAALEDAALGASPVFAQAEWTPSALGQTWLAMARELEAGGRPAEAILASARAAAARGDVHPLRAALERLALPRTAASARGLADALVAQASRRLDLVANGLAYGADAATLLRSLASSLTGRDRVALDLVNAAVLLAPDRSDCRITRALVNIHLGRPDAARSDVASLPPELASQREFLELQARILFPTFDFTPATTELQTRWTEVPEGPSQPLDTVRVQIQKYATRLGRVRAAVLARLPPGAPPPWCPPDLANLLPEGPLPLETWQFEETLDEPGDAPSNQPSDVPDAKPPEIELVTVDETMTLDGATPLPALMRAARRDWNGLCWLCWGVGLDRVAMPNALLPRDGFGIALGMSVERLWRCRDRILTRGLRSRIQGVPDFEWEGTAIDRLSPLHAEMAADEYREMRAVLCWLYDDSVQSPWQDNVRKLD
jgi:MORN repeat protein